MNYRTKAIYRGGAFVPETQCDLPEEMEVELLVQAAPATPPAVVDPLERARILRRVADRMRQNPVRSDAPSFSRDELHERR
jgi:hypothetical protein